MNNPAIQQTLIELQDSLLKIESARTQVNNISEKSELLISSFTSVLKSIESISDGVGIDKKAIKENLDESFKNFAVGLKEISDQSDVRIKSIDENLKTNQISFQDGMDGHIKSFESSIKKIVSNFEANSIEQISLLKTSNQDLISEIKNVNSELVSFQDNLKKIEKEITELDFVKEFHLLSNKMDSKHKQNLILNSVLFLLIIIILFATK